MDIPVSVLVPVYNGQDYIKEFLESVSGQTYLPIELVIVDDHSTDKSFMICEQWCEKNGNRFTNIWLYRNETNIGLTETTNKLFELSSGEYLFLADQDDVWLPQKLERQVGYMIEHDECMINLVDRSVADENLNVKIESEFSHLKFSIQSMDFDEFIRHRKHDTAANIMCIRASQKKVLTVPSGIVEHDRFIATMAVCMGTIDYIYEPLVLYRIHRGNLSQNYSMESASSVFKAFISQYIIAKRSKRSQKDNIIIKKELKNRFKIDLDEYNHRLFGGEAKRKILLCGALEKTLKAYKKGIIGIWNK